MRVKLGASDLVEMGRVKCKPGKIRRSGYTRKDGVHVKAACVPDVGAPGKTPASKKFMPKMGPGALGGWKKDQPASVRRAKIMKKLKSEPCVKVIRKVNVIANVTTDKETENKLRADYAYVRKQDACKLKTKK